MRQDKLEERKRQQLAALFGLEEHLPTEPTPTQQINQENKSREAEAVLEYYSSRQTFKPRPCKWCESVFAANRGNVAYCSDSCRQKALAEIGIIWDPSKDPRERWDLKIVLDDGQLMLPQISREPLIVPPPALLLADKILESQVETPETPETLSETSESEIQSTPIVYSL